MAVVSADTLQLSHVEMVDGAVPASPTMKLWRTTGETLVFEPNATESGELGGDGRSSKPSNVTGMTTSGDISFELSKFPALEEAMEGVCAEDWGECPLTGAPGGAINDDTRLTVGRDQKVYMIEKRFPNPANIEGTVVTASMDAPSASMTLTVTGAAGTGTGVMMFVFAVDGGAEILLESPISVGDDNIAAAAAAATVLNADSAITATDNLDGTVTITPTTGTAFTTGSVRSGPDEYFYQRYVGCSYSVLSISVAPNTPVTGSVSIVGGEPILDSLPLDGTTYESAGTSAVFTAPEVMELSVGTMLGVGTHCWTTLEITIDSQNRGIPCIGTTGDRETVLGKAAIALNGDVYFSDDAVLQAILDNATVGDGAVTLSNADDDIYRFDFFGLKPVSGSLNAGGTGEDLTMPLSFEPTPVAVCDDGGGNSWTSGVIVSTVDVAPTLP